jgi:hypothetical protein
MHDQEPLQFQHHQFLWSEIMDRAQGSGAGAVIVSERGGQLRRLRDIYGWQPHYYFFHGWAALDWYRGYDRNLLLQHPAHRVMPRRTFMSPNRIIGGERDHRVLFVYLLARHGLMHNHISVPRICPYEHTDILVVADKFRHAYPDIVDVLASLELPRFFQNEHEQLMSSSTLGNYAEVHDSMIYVPTETVYWGDRTHLTEKTMKAMALGMLLIPVAPAGTLEYLKEYGFRTFHDLWDESYDQETNDLRRLERVTALLADIDGASHQDRAQIWRHSRSIVQHNWDHFYRGGLLSVLDREFNSMLNQLKTFTL